VNQHNTENKETKLTLDQLNQDIATTGGRYMKCFTKEHGNIEGTVVEYEKRDRTDPDGNVVFKKGSTTARKVWTFTIQLDDTDPNREGPDDDGLRKFDANESMQRAISDAIKEAGAPAKAGDRIKVGVKTEAPDKFSQAEYQAKWTPGAPALDIDPEEF